MKRPRPVPPAPGQESVWDYPRPPRLERTSHRIAIEHRGVTLVDSTRAWRVLETSHPPVYFVPQEDVREGALQPSSRRASGCEWKGRAVYFDVDVGGELLPASAFAYPDPTPAFKPIADCVAFYAGPFEACRVGAEVAQPQPGDFYAGWITRDVVGPFKGEPGTMGW